jgi:hypothetical protein
MYLMGNFLVLPSFRDCHGSEPHGWIISELADFGDLDTARLTTAVIGDESQRVVRSSVDLAEVKSRE